MTSPGELSHRLVLEAPVEVDDGAGGRTRDFAAVTTLWAALTPLAGRYATEAAAAGATITHRIVIRARPGLTTRHRFRAGARVFQLLAIRAPHPRFLEIDAQERVG